MLFASALHTVLISGACCGPVQDDPLVQESVGVLMVTVRDMRKDLISREEAMEELLQRGVAGALPLAREMERQGKRRVEEYAKQERRLLLAFERAAPRLLGRRMDRKRLLEIKDLRSELLEFSRSPDLTKAQIKQSCDPIAKRLEELLSISPEQVFEEDEELSKLMARVEFLADEAWVLRDWWADCVGVLRGAQKGERIVARLKGADDLDGRIEIVEDRLFQAARRATPMPDRDREVFLGNDELREQLDPEEFEGNRLLNLLRVRLGLSALKAELELTRASRGHSRDMVEQGFFSHSSPIEGKESPWKRAALEGSSAGAENIAAGQNSGAGAIRAWWYSPGHHRNMLGSHARVGLGRHESHWTQMFGR